MEPGWSRSSISRPARIGICIVVRKRGPATMTLAPSMVTAPIFIVPLYVSPALRLGHAYTGTQAAHHFDPVEVSVAIHTIRSGTVYERSGVQRKVEVWRHRRVDSEKFRRRDADHREGNVIDENRLSNRIRRSPKAILACRKADYGDRRCAWTVVFGVDQTSRGRRHRQAAKILAGDVLRAGARCLPLNGQVKGVSVEVSEERGKHGILLAKRLERAVREHPADHGAFVARPENALYAVNDVDPLLAAIPGRLAMPIQDHQRLGIGHRQRALQNRLHEAVDRSIGPDAERQQ